MSINVPTLKLTLPPTPRLIEEVEEDGGENSLVLPPWESLPLFTVFPGSRL